MRTNRRTSTRRLSRSQVRMMVRLGDGGGWKKDGPWQELHRERWASLQPTVAAALERRGLVRVRVRPPLHRGEPRRRMVCLTAAGRRWLAEHGPRKTHARLHLVLHVDPRDHAPWGTQDRENHADCSCGCAFYVPLEGRFGGDWGVCCNPASHRAGKLTFEHQGCTHFTVPNKADETLDPEPAPLLLNPEGPPDHGKEEDLPP